MGEYIVDINYLSRKFGNTQALQDVTLRVPRGGVFGLDPVKEPVKVLGRIGYMSENRDVPGWMRIQELIDFTSTFYPSWDPGYVTELLELFELDSKQRIRNLSRGQTARVCLLLALAHRPELLVLDEPSSGLDPVIRRDILAAIVRTTAEDGRTVLFSSHLLDEVERLADRIALIHQGRVVFEDSLESVLESFHRVTIRFDRSYSVAPCFDGAIDSRGQGYEWTYVVRGDKNRLEQTAQSLHAQIVGESPLSLDDIFVSNIHGS